MIREIWERGAPVVLLVVLGAGATGPASADAGNQRGVIDGSTPITHGPVLKSDLSIGLGNKSIVTASTDAERPDFKYNEAQKLAGLELLNEALRLVEISPENVDFVITAQQRLLGANPEEYYDFIVGTTNEHLDYYPDGLGGPKRLGYIKNVTLEGMPCPFIEEQLYLWTGIDRTLTGLTSTIPFITDFEGIEELAEGYFISPKEVDHAPWVENKVSAGGYLFEVAYKIITINLGEPSQEFYHVSTGSDGQISLNRTSCVLPPEPKPSHEVPTSPNGSNLA